MKRALYAGAYVASLSALLLSGWWLVSRASADVEVRHWCPVVVSQLLLLLTLPVSALVWRRIVDVGIGLKIEMPAAMLHVCMNATGKYLPGKIWGLLARHRALLLSGTTNTSAVVALALEQASLFTAAAVIAAPALVTIATRPETPILVLAAVAVLVAAILAWRVGPKRKLLVGNLPPARSLLPIVALNGLQWLMSGVAFVLLAVGLGVKLDGPGIVLLASAVPAAVVAGMVAFFAPGGVGVREGVLILFGAPIIGGTEALAAALILRVLATVRDVVCVLWLPFLVKSSVPVATSATTA